MINLGFNLATLLGINLVGIAIFLPVVALMKQPPETGKVVQGFALAPFYFFAGLILLFNGWRFNSIMQFSQIFLVGLNVYWIAKDLRR